ncbi:MAG: prefoldin subunit beta [Candidatus Bathyarchaeota archaeon]
MSDVEVPPNIQEELAKLQQLQQTLQVIVAQKQQVEVELTDVDKALEEIKKMPNENPVYQAIGAFLVRRDKETIIKELTERRELLTVRASVLGKQEERTRERLREIQQQVQARLREQKLM